MKLLRNEKGSMMLSAFAVVFVILIMVFFLKFISIQITCIGIENTIKNEINNVTIKISEDTYSAMREGSLTAYHNKLASDTAYHAELMELAKECIEKAIPKSSTYLLSDIKISFTENIDNIEYIITCDIYLRDLIFGQTITWKAEQVEINARHYKKIY